MKPLTLISLGTTGRAAVGLSLLIASLVLGSTAVSFAANDASKEKTVPTTEKYGPAAAVAFAGHYKGDAFVPNVQYCYPDAMGVPFADCENILPMSATLWKPAELAADFQRRMQDVPASTRKKGIIVILKTERCATKWLRACTVTTAALEKRSTPLAAEFLIYGALIQPRDGDDPPGTLKIETGADAWKNEAAGEYHFIQGPGATLVFLNPKTGEKMDRTDAVALNLFEEKFLENAGRTPELHAKLDEILGRLRHS